MIKGLELKMIKKIPRGRYLTAREKIMKLTVPVAHRHIKVPFNSGVMSEKKLTLERLTIIAEAHMLKNDLKKTNS